MKIEEGKKYKLQNGLVVTFEKTKLPYYKFVVKQKELYGECFTEDGVAYHDDCNCNVVEEVK